MLSHLVKGYRHLISKTVRNNKQLCCIAQQTSHTFVRKVDAATLHFDYFASSVDHIPISSWHERYNFYLAPTLFKSTQESTLFMEEQISHPLSVE